MARRLAASGVVTGVTGVSLLARGVRAFRSGEYRRATNRLLAGGILATIAMGQRRSPDEQTDDGGQGTADQTDVADTAPDIEDAVSGINEGTKAGTSSGSGAGTEIEIGEEDDLERDGGTESNGDTDEQDSEGTTSDVEAASGAEPETEGAKMTPDQTDAAGADVGDESEGGDTETIPVASEQYDRLGAAAFDEHSGEVPAPQRAFNQRFLAEDAEAIWGVRETDDVVVVSQLYDAIEDREELRYVASTSIGEDRILSVPDDVRDHWESTIGDGAILESGDDIVFVTTDDLADDSLLLVVPAKWSEEILGTDET